MGVMRPLQPQSSEPGYCQRWMGQAGEGALAIDYSDLRAAIHMMLCDYQKKYLLLQSLRAMRQPITNALMYTKEHSESRARENHRNQEC